MGHVFLHLTLHLLRPHLMSVISNGSLHSRLHYRVCRYNLSANVSLFFCVSS